MTRRKLLSFTALTSAAGCGFGQPADFALPDLSGKTVRLSDYRGKVVLLNFWATWCGYCVREMPWFIEYADQFRSRGFEVIGVALDEEGWDVVRPFVEKMGVNYPVVVSGWDLAFQYNALALPTTWLIDRDGGKAGFHKGMVNREELRKEIEALL